ncbi:MAG: hypothetical protein EXX96DRAFT_561933 [Benjaminiella poitrasii]|nr:MAG: hypothetical protein EXX96DRAFT_561933 [Benjaminiella poitrasii]
MSNFEGFIFHDPSDEQLKTTKDDEDVMNKTITDLTFQFDRINEKECKKPFETNRTSLLSNKSTKESQEKRRLIALELQKKQRQITTSKLRQIASGALTDDDDNDDDDESKDEVQSVTAKRIRDTDEDMEYNGILTKIKKTNPNKKSKKQRAVEIYANQIMYAEYLESIPEDFVDNWVTIICPKGKRCLITSGNGQTIARSRSGHVIKRFQSILPSGSRYSLNQVDYMHSVIILSHLYIYICTFKKDKLFF